MSFELTEYLSQSVEGLVKDAIKATFTNPRGSAFFMQFINRVKKANRIREEYENRGKHIPPFLIGSITDSCNLFCKGCYARENKICGESLDQTLLSAKRWQEIFIEAEAIGISFVLLAGGEPFMRPDILEYAGKIPGILFPIFTNGMLIDDKAIHFLDHHRNLIPVISVEGNQEQTDARRGEGTYNKLENVMQSLINRKILFGTSITVTTENCTTVTEDGFIRDLNAKGCKLVFYVEYVPVTDQTMQLAPTDKERAYLDQRLSALRKAHDDMIFISFPGDETATGGCLAAGRGFFHINPAGDAEPCPFSPYSDTNLLQTGLLEALNSPLFQKLHHSDLLLQDHRGGCVLFGQKEQVSRLLKE